MKTLKKLTPFIFVLLSFQTYSQTSFHTIGTDTVRNSAGTYPSPYGNWFWGAKNQFLIQASELVASGMSAGDIYSISFDVYEAATTSLDDFQVSIKLTSDPDLSAGIQNGLTTVASPQSYSDIDGWNLHDFSTPFFWDGSSNIIIETCFNNSSWSFPGNAIMNMSTYGYKSTCVRRSDNANVCSSNWTNEDHFDRPNIKIEWQDPNTPPGVDFNSNSLTTCSGTVNFNDLSTNSPTSWLWNFGDGNTSTDQNPIHTYTSSGTYSVTLQATNSNGSNSLTQNNFITVNLGGFSPANPSCIPATQNGTLGFGITNVTLNNLNVNSGNAIEGYSDFTCDSTGLYVGLTYPISISHNSPTTHQCAVWIDFNNDGSFSNAEEVIRNSSSTSTTGNILIPSNSVLNIPLRMRVIADYDLSPQVDPCTDPEYGQAEDYTVFVFQDTTPPIANVNSDINYTCNGIVNFTDISSNAPFAWAWDFGDGSTSVAQNPSHIYTLDGSYDVQLIATNQYGSDTINLPGYIQVATSNSVVSSSCSPPTLGYCCKYGILKVIFNTIVNPTLDGYDGYQDYSCEFQTYVDMGDSYQLSITTGPDNPQDTKVWIDVNNDGNFDNSELFLESLNSYSPSTNITIPNNLPLMTPLRMRISSDEVGNNFDACTDMVRGQVEDYAIIVNDTACPNPTNLTVSVSGTNAEVDWDAGGSETNWNIEYGPTGFNLGFGNTLNTSTKPRIISMPSGECFEFYVQANCGSSLSGWTGPVEACTVGVLELNKVNFNLYPNPSNGTVSLKTDNSDLRQINVYNLIGELVHSESSLNYNNTTLLNLTALSNGTYLIEAIDKDGFKGIKKFIIQ